MRTASFVFSMICLCVMPAAFAGSLTPPGAPAPTMKTLDEVEARTPISSLPYTISQPGSYYVTQDLTLATEDTDGITINVDKVSVDLNGFTLTGPGKAAGSTGSGIRILSTHYNIAVRNGTVRDWRYAGVYGSGTTVSHFEDLRCYNNGLQGVYVGDQNIVHNNICVSNGEEGIRSGFSCLVTGNLCKYNTADGIFAINSTVTGNHCAENGGDGIRVMTYCQVRNNTCVGNGQSEADGAGVQVVLTSLFHGYNCIERNVVTGNKIGIDVDSQSNYIGDNRATNNATADYDIAASNTEGTGDRSNISY